MQVRQGLAMLLWTVELMSYGVAAHKVDQHEHGDDPKHESGC